MTVVISVIVAACIQQPQDPSTVEVPLPRIHATAGDVRVWAAATDRIAPPTDGQPLPPQDRVGAAPGSGAAIGFSVDGETLISLKGVFVGKGRGLKIERATREQLVLTLTGGVAFVEATRSFEVKVGKGRVSGAGADVLIDASSDPPRVLCVRGDAVYTGPAGTRFDLPTGTAWDLPGDKERPPKPVEEWRNPGGGLLSNPPGNLIGPNAGFELGEKGLDLKPDDSDGKEILWDLNLQGVGAPAAGHIDVKVDSSVHKLSPNSLKVILTALPCERGKRTQIPIYLVRPDLLQEGRDYRLSFWVLGEKLTVNRAPSTSFLDAAVCYTRDGHFEVPCPVPEKAWSRISLGFTASKNRQFKFHLSTKALEPGGECSGALWMDDFSLRLAR